TEARSSPATAGAVVFPIRRGRQQQEPTSSSSAAAAAIHRYPRGRRLLPPPHTPPSPPRIEPEARSSPASHGAEVFSISRALHRDFSAHPLLHRDFSAAATSAPPIAPHRIAGSSRLLPSPSRSDWFLR
ncbi:Os02g0477100, partial [Oryza sativa Japonica Group]